MTRAAGVVFSLPPTIPPIAASTLSYPNNTTTEYGCDLLSRLSLIRLEKRPAVLSEISYESNDLDNRTARTEDGTRLSTATTTSPA